MSDHSESMPDIWAQKVAREIIEEYCDAAAIDTGSYKICGFLIAAAEVALKDVVFAYRIGEIMEKPRWMDL